MIAKGYQFEMISDIGSGINYNKKGLNHLIDSTDKTEEQELVEDLVQIVTVLSCSLQGKRAHKAKKMIKELLENDTGEES